MCILSGEQFVTLQERAYHENMTMEREFSPPGYSSARPGLTIPEDFWHPSSRRPGRVSVPFSELPPVNPNHPPAGGRKIASLPSQGKVHRSFPPQIQMSPKSDPHHSVARRMEESDLEYHPDTPADTLVAAHSHSKYIHSGRASFFIKEESQNCPLM